MSSRTMKLVAVGVSALLLCSVMSPLTAGPAAAATAVATPMSAGNAFSCGVIDGGAQCWGSGAIGDGTFHRPTRGPVPGLGSGVVSVAGGFLSACALTTAGAVKCWGDNRSGQLGDGTTIDRSTPVDVVGLGSGVAQIDTDGYHSCALTTAGAVKCWGWSQNLTPADVPTLGSGMASIAVGFNSACAVSTAGAVYCWGGNHYGQLGDGTMTDHVDPILVPKLASGVKSISVSQSYGCAVTTAGGVKCWGTNQSGELGPAPTVVPSPPVTVPVTDITAVATGSDATCALTTAGRIKCWGRGGLLGDGSTANRSTPGFVTGIVGATGVAVGTNHACAMTTTEARCWGFGGDGELGNDAYDQDLTPVPVVYVPARIVPLGGEVAETDAPATSTVDITVSLSVPSTSPVTVDWATFAGPATLFEATPGVDYVPASGHLTFAPGQRFASASVTVLGDDLAEVSESLHISLTNPVGAPLGNQSGTYGIIRDDEPSPTVLPGGAVLTEGNAGTSVLHVPVTLSGPSSQAITVDWKTLFVAGVTIPQATPGADYVAAAGAVTFAPGQTSTVVDIAVVGDVVAEPDEVLIVSFTNPRAAVMGGFWGLGLGFITNND